MIHKAIILMAFAIAYASADCLRCICEKESGCRAIGCNMDEGSLSCGYYQIKRVYYQDCGQPDQRPGESLDDAWKRCSDDYNCATKCVQAYYNRYKSQCDGTGQGACEVMARNHNRGPTGCKNANSQGYWNDVHNCCRCS